MLLTKRLTIMLLCFATMEAFASISPTYPAPPMYHIKASSLYDAGLQQGKLASSRIQGWLSSPEMVSLLNYSATAGRDAFEAIKRDNTAAYPALVKELEGLSAGSGVPLDTIWVSTLILELESLRSYPPGGADHCSDLYAVPEAGVSQGFAHGHNEDWPGPIRNFWYLVTYIPLPGANFEACAGVAYPGALIGWAASWNANGLYLTQNALFPIHNLPRGISSAFAQRAALCGAGEGPSGRRASATLDELLGAVTPSGAADAWSTGASLNLVSLGERRLANVEVLTDSYAVHELDGRKGGNWSHFNLFKLPPFRGHADERSSSVSSQHRQARVDALPPVRSATDVAARLSDTADEAFPIYRNMTLHTLILDGLSGTLRMWCCGRRAAFDEPQFTWHLPSFGLHATADWRGGGASLISESSH